MSQNDLKGMRVAILATDGFEQVELLDPRKALEEAGANTTILSPSKGPIQGMNHDEKGDKISVDLQIDQAKPEDFDAILLPGGVVNADTLRMVKSAQQFVQAIQKVGKPIAVICHGSWLLVSAGLVKGRRLTTYYTLQDDIRNAGGRWTDEEVVIDQNWVSSRQPDDIPAFNKAMLQVFSLRHTNKAAAKA